MGEAKNGALKLQFDGHLRLEFRGAKVTTDAGLLAVRELDEALKLTEMAGEMIQDNRTGKCAGSLHGGHMLPTLALIVPCV